VQQDGADGHRLSMYRSVDEAKTWSWYAPIQDACCERDTADLIAVGMDVAMVFSYEGPRSRARANTTSTSAVALERGRRLDAGAQGQGLRLDVEHDRLSPRRDRARLAGPHLGLGEAAELDGTFTLVLSVSTDGGASFQAQPALDTFGNRPGGRILPVGGGRLMLLYSTHNGGAGYMRLRNDSDPLSTWSARELVFPEGIYHGAALSAAGDGSGGVHLVYKDSAQRLLYRRWSGSWSAKQTVEAAGTGRYSRRSRASAAAW